MLGQFLLHHAQRVAGAADRSFGVLAEQVWQGTDVIFVGVGEQHGRDLWTRRAQVREVGRDDLDAQGGLAPGKQDAAVDHQARLRGFDREAVHPHLAQTAERHQSDGRGRSLHDGAT